MLLQLTQKLFKLKQNGSNVRTELIAGLTTFMTMAYILAVNPAILSASGMDAGAIFTATALVSALATFCMAFLANLPFVLSAGMGLNAFFAYTVVIGMGYAWQQGLVPISFDALMRAYAYGEGPVAVVMHTVKGKGVSFMEDQAGWHGKAPNAEELAQALAEIDAADAAKGA